MATPMSILGQNLISRTERLGELPDHFVMVFSDFLLKNMIFFEKWQYDLFFLNTMAK